MMRDDTQDGDVDPVYVDFMTGIPANIVPVTGGERYRGKQIEATTSIVIECRYYSGFNTQMVAENEFTGDQYLISRIIDHQGRQRTLIMESTEVA
jgi:hypothetical protein